MKAITPLDYQMILINLSVPKIISYTSFPNTFNYSKENGELIEILSCGYIKDQQVKEYFDEAYQQSNIKTHGTLKIPSDDNDFALAQEKARAIYSVWLKAFLDEGYKEKELPISMPFDEAKRFLNELKDKYAIQEIIDAIYNGVPARDLIEFL